MRSNNLKLAFISYFIRYGLGLASYPIFLHYLSTLDAAIYFLILNTSTIFDILDLNFKNNLVIQFSQAEADNVLNKGSSRFKYSELLAFSKYFYSLICLLALVLVGLGFGVYLYYYLKLKGLDTHFSKYFFIWIIFCLGSILQVYYTYLGPALTSKGHIDWVNRLSINTKLVSFIIQIVLLISGVGLIAMAISALAATVYERFTIYRYYKENIKESQGNLKIKFAEFKSIFKKLWSGNYKLGLVSLSLIANARIPAYFIGMLNINQNEITAYLFSLQIMSLIFSVSHVPLVNHFADLSFYYIQDRNKFNKTFAKANWLSIKLYSFLIVIFIIAGPLIINYFSWKRMVFNYEFLVLLAVIYFLEKVLLNYTTLITVTNIVPMYKAFVVSSLSILIVQFVFVKIFNGGMISIFLPQLVIQSIFNYWFWVRKGKLLLNSPL